MSAGQAAFDLYKQQTSAEVKAEEVLAEARHSKLSHEEAALKVKSTDLEARTATLKQAEGKLVTGE